MHDDVDVAVRSTLFVPEADCVTDLVCYRTVLHADNTILLLLIIIIINSGEPGESVCVIGAGATALRGTQSLRETTSTSVIQVTHGIVLLLLCLPV